MTNKPSISTERLGMHSLFEGLSEEYVEGVAGRVLSHLGRASPESRRAFQTELDRLNLRIPGFRNASKAPAHLLTTPVQVGLLHSDDLAGTTLRVWAESHQSLCESISERLNDIGAYIGVSANYPNSDENRLRGHWPKDAWKRERDRFAGLHDHSEESDIELMMCYVSGLMPGTADADDEQDSAPEAVEQIHCVLNLLKLCAVDLEEVPVSAPEWESDIPELVDRIAEIVGAKREERSRAATLDTFISSMVDDFSAELSYLESDISAWSADKLSESGDIATALSMCEELRSTLTELRAVRESGPGATRSAERERRDRNDELEDEALGLLNRIGRLMSGGLLPDDDPPIKSDRIRNRPETSTSSQTEPPTGRQSNAAPTSRHPQAFPELEKEQLWRENVSLQSERDELNQLNESLRTENSRLESENESLRSKNRTLANDVQFLRADKADIERSVEALRSRLTATENDAETWRLAYEEESRIPRMTVKDVPMHIENVSDAVKYAEDMFPDRLLLKTNSKSQVRDNPFEKPEDVWEALKWLATSYRDARAGVSSVPDFDLSVRETCGWQYKSDQHETTRNKYREWYTTKTNNKTYWLLEHIGTGASKDARHTIRIAFDWDKDEKLVVVGYIGQHQRTDAT